MRGVQRQLFLPAGYPSPKAVGAIFSRSQVHIRRMLLEGSPVIVAMRPHERPSRRRICCISSARFRLTPLAPAEVLAGGFDPLQPRQRSLPDQVALHLREDDGQVQHRPPHALSWSMDSRRLMISTPFSRNQISTSVSDWPSLSSPRPSHGPLAGAGLQEIQSRPVLGALAASVLEDRSQSASTLRWFSRLLASASLNTGTRAYPWSFPLFFRWPPVLARRRDATVGGVLAMLESVPFWQR